MTTIMIEGYKMDHPPMVTIDNVGPPGRPKRNKSKSKAQRKARKLNR